MFSFPRNRINGKSVNTLSGNVEASTALIVINQENILCNKVYLRMRMGKSTILNWVRKTGSHPKSKTI
jgi:hypothetical protein